MSLISFDSLAQEVLAHRRVSCGMMHMPISSASGQLRALVPPHLLATLPQGMSFRAMLVNFAARPPGWHCLAPKRLDLWKVCSSLPSLTQVCEIITATWARLQMACKFQIFGIIYHLMRGSCGQASQCMMRDTSHVVKCHHSSLFSAQKSGLQAIVNKICG